MYLTKDEITIKDKQFRVLITAEQIQQRVNELSETINRDYRGKTPVMLGILTGAAIFTADLFRRIDEPCELSFIRVSSYHGGMQSSGKVTQIVGLKESIANRHVLIVEDIVDTGETLQYIWKELLSHKPASLKLATALFKPGSLKYNVRPDYIGFEVGSDFLVGYGLDYDGLGRNYNDIYTLKT